ncbi:dna damage-binding protein 1 [Stylonychia lemnae]|uniref:Dna damage-binding protein 1 n=1 Tax=Stylonychia lemnae TaxID=5949 RepID=A0A078A8K9_STYLE|nr:dna damage-binding protein 1 [Stylonychia lemnae]|eukprot:CDW78610.1 dna damage-binding protein 1 [Stylonychia lemnae]
MDYFYHATYKSGNAVTQSLKCNFTLSPYSEEEVEIMTKNNQIRQGDSKSMFKLDSNLIIAKSNNLQVMKLTETDIEEIYTIPINDQIVSILRISSDCILEKAGKPMIGKDPKSDKKAQDFLFVLTAEYNCLLFAHDHKQGIHCISTGNIQDITGQKREPPYSVFLGSNGKYIGLMLYENIIKVIPLVKSQNNKIALSNAFNVRIRHPEAHQIIPLMEDDQPGSSTLAVFYQQQTSRPQNMNQTSLVLRVKKYTLNMADKDIEPTSNDDQVDLESSTTYRIKELDFGGFLAFDPEYIHCFRKRIKNKIISKKLRKPMKITAFNSIDQYDPIMRKTKDGQSLMRYLFATECGEFYLLAFNLENLHLINGFGAVNPLEANQFMIIEFLAHKLSSCSSLNYLDNGFVYYGSKLGESMLLLLETENTGHKDRPYVTIKKQYESLGIITDMVIKEQTNSKVQQKELIVLGGQGHNSHISVLRKGATLKILQTIESLPMLNKNGIFIVNKMILLSFYGFNHLLCLHTEKTVNDLSEDVTIKESNYLESIQIDPSDQILAVKEVEINQERLQVIVSQSFIKILKNSFQDLAMEFKFDNGLEEINNTSIEKNMILISSNHKNLYYFDLSSVITNPLGLMIPNSLKQFDYYISAVALSEQASIGYVAFWDAPYYSINVIDLQKMQVLARRASIGYVDARLSRDFHKNHQTNTRINEEEEMMQIDTESTQMAMINNMNDQFPCLAISSIQLVSIGDQDQIICGLIDGRILSLIAQRDMLVRIIDQPESFPPQLNLMFSGELFQDSKPDVADALWNIRPNRLGNQQVNLRKYDSQFGKLIFAQSDKPAIFYQRRGELTIQYLNQQDIKQANNLYIDDLNLIIYENTAGSLIIGQIEDLLSSSLLQYKFEKDVTKLIMPDENIIMVLMEAPNFEYLDQNSTAVNNMAIMDVNNFNVLDSYDFQKIELPNCIYQFNKKNHPTTLSIKNQSVLVAIGTAYLDLEEQFPSKGRLIIFEIDFTRKKAVERHIEQINGSVQSISTLREDNKYLLLGVNLEVHLYSVTQRGQEIRLALLQQIAVGTCIQEIKVVNNTVVVGDIMRAIYTFDFKEQKQNKMLCESAHSNHSIWTNCVITLSNSHFMVFDKEANVFVIQKILLPVNDHEKFKLNLVSCMKIGEEVTKAVFGSLNIPSESVDASMAQSVTRSGKEKSYYHGKTRSSRKRNNEQVKELLMDQTNIVDDNLLLNDKDYLKLITKQALIELIKLQDAQQIIYGTSQGSLGVICQIPLKAYKILELLSKTMEKLDMNFYGKLSRVTFRSAKTESLKQEATNIIDGDYVQNYLDSEMKFQNTVIQQMLKDYNQEFARDIKGILEILKDKN